MVAELREGRRDVSEKGNVARVAETMLWVLQAAVQI